MTKKKAFVLRIDVDKLEAIEKWASDEFRSINGQIEWLIDKSLKEAGRIKTSNKKNQEEDHENKSSA
jgi:hypothetical protein